MADIPTTEPETLRAGDTWTWKRSLADYPASAGWILTYSLRKSDAKLDLVASASGADHLVNLSAATSAPVSPGTYSVIGCVSKAAERFTVFEGQFVVQPNLAANANLDARTHAEKVLAAIETVLEGRATKELLTTTVEGITLGRIPHADLILMHDRYQAIVNHEREATRLARGLKSRRNIHVRFG